MYVYILLLIILLGCITVNEKFYNYIPYLFFVNIFESMWTYDMRCLPHIKKQYVPWGYGTIYPNHYGKCLELK